VREDDVFFLRKSCFMYGINVILVVQLYTCTHTLNGNDKNAIVLDITNIAENLYRIVQSFISKY